MAVGSDNDTSCRAGRKGIVGGNLDVGNSVRDSTVVRDVASLDSYLFSGGVERTNCACHVRR